MRGRGGLERADRSHRSPASAVPHRRPGPTRGHGTFRDTVGTWQTRQAVGSDVLEVGCLGDYQLSFEAVYQGVLLA